MNRCSDEAVFYASSVTSDQETARFASALSEAFGAVIFDMDGLIIDSEPLWHEAEISILGGLGVPLVDASCRKTKGMFVNEVTSYWFDRFPWSGPEPDEVADQVVEAVMRLVVEKGTLKPGAKKAVQACRRSGLAMAVASSSAYRLISLVLEKFSLHDQFDVVHSAQDEPYGKPHPGVFLTAAAKIGVPPQACLVWEDSPAGVLAAKSARMTCVAVPEYEEREDRVFGVADLVIASLDDVDAGLFESLARDRNEAEAVALR